MKKIILKIIRLYQATLSPDHSLIFYGSSINCRFYPSCSQYAYEAIKRFGVSTGIAKGLMRIVRCSPFSKGGIDLV